MGPGIGYLVFVSRSLFVSFQHTRPFPFEIAVFVKGFACFISYGFVTNGKYLWSPRREILQFQWQFQLETAWCAGFKQKVIVRQKPSSLLHSGHLYGPGTLIGIDFHPETAEK